jgi:hypothetical protein
MTPAEMLAEARALLDQQPESGRRATASLRLIRAQWLIAEADHARVAMLLDPGAPATKAHQVVMGPVRQFRTDPLPTTAETVVEDACPSRYLDRDTGEILHCDGSRFCVGPIVDPMREHHNGVWTWSDVGAMPADQPCDRRCAQCVERTRTRDALIDAAIEWRDTVWSARKLMDAIDEYRKVMGR